MRPLYYRVCRGASFFLAVVAFSVTLHPPALAIDISTLVKKVGKIPNSVEVKHLDDIARQSATAKAGREILQKSGYRADDAIERARLLRKALGETLTDVDPVVLRQLDKLDEASQQAILALSRGARNLEAGIPDVALRSRFLQDGGGEMLCTLGRYDGLMDDAIRFDTALRAGNIKVPLGARNFELRDFGQFFYSQGDRAHHFWVTSVRPHWKLWLGGSALAAIMLAPNEYLDTVGDLTGDGLDKLGHTIGNLLGKALSGTIKGVGEGANQATREASEAFFETFFTSVWGVVSFFVLAVVMTLLIPWTRNRLFRRIKSSPEPK